MSKQKAVKWISPLGHVFKLQYVQDTEYTRKHIGEVQENPTVTKTVHSGTSITNSSSNTSSINSRSGVSSNNGLGASSSSSSGHSSSSGTTVSSTSGVHTNSRTGSKIINHSADTFQDLGVAGRDIPLTIKFYGDDHDIQAQKFEKAWCEIGQSRLQLHYGNEIKVNALELTKKSSVVNNVSATIFELKFHETSKTTFPNAQSVKKSDLKLTSKVLNTTNAQNLSTTFNKISQKASNYKKFMSNFTNKLDMITGKLENIQDSKYFAILYDIKSQMPFNNALVMGTQIGLLYQSGITLFDHASNILDVCESALNELMPDEPDYPTLAGNDFYAQNTIINTVQALVDSNIQTRKEAILAAQRFQTIGQNYQQYIDTQQINVPEYENVEGINIHSLIQNTAGTLIESSYLLKTEMNIILDEPSNLLQLAYEYYHDDFESDPDGVVDYLVSTNDFKDDDFLFLGKGRKILIYV